MVKYLLLIPLLVGYISTASAQWHSDSTTNTVVCQQAYSQQNPSACSDGANGVIVVWEDYRFGNGWDIYAQRINADGNKVWADTGVAICTSLADQRAPHIV